MVGVEGFRSTIKRLKYTATPVVLYTLSIGSKASLETLAACHTDRSDQALGQD